MSWVLIIYLAGYGGAGGGPTTAEFLRQADCETAASAIKEKATRFYQWHVCVPNGR